MVFSLTTDSFLEIHLYHMHSCQREHSNRRAGSSSYLVHVPKPKLASVKSKACCVHHEAVCTRARARVCVCVCVCVCVPDGGQAGYPRNVQGRGRERDGCSHSLSVSTGSTLCVRGAECGGLQFPPPQSCCLPPPPISAVPASCHPSQPLNHPFGVLTSKSNYSTLLIKGTHHLHATVVFLGF